jgi:hypothetical protein
MVMGHGWEIFESESGGFSSTIAGGGRWDKNERRLSFFTSRKAGRSQMRRGSQRTR